MRFAYFLPAMLLSASLGMSAEVTWTGAVNNQWSNPGNWLGNAVPAPSDSVIFPELKPSRIVDLGGDVEIFSVGSYMPFPPPSQRSNLTLGAGPVGSQTLTLVGAPKNSGQTSTLFGLSTINANVILGKDASAEAYTIYGPAIYGRISGGVGGTSGLKEIKAIFAEFYGEISDGGGKVSLTCDGGASFYAQNTYTGPTMFMQGMLTFPGIVQLFVENAFSELSDLTLYNNGIVSNGFDQHFGKLSVSSFKGATPSIDFGSGNCDFSFAASNGLFYSHLVLNNFNVGIDSLRFGTDAFGLNASDLSKIDLTGYYASGLDDNGYVIFTPIPEPGTLSLLLLCLASAACLRLRNRPIPGAAPE